MSELLPCPFCGGTNLKSGGDDKVVGTWCLTCEASGPNQYGRHEWNTRANASSQAEIERLRTALAFYADPEIYKPHPDGPAFDRRDVSYVARSALEGK